MNLPINCITIPAEMPFLGTLAGWLLEQQRHGLGLWLLMGGLCLPALALTQQKPAARARNY